MPLLKMFKNAAEFLNTLEQIHPLGSHHVFQEEWSSSLLDHANDHCFHECATTQNVLEGVLSFREALHSAATERDNIQVVEKTTDDSWKWLLSVNQVEQRTLEWYAETKNLLTASEVGRLFEGGPSARNALVRSKSEDQPPILTPRLAVMRNETGPMDWGTRYEPVVKQILESSLSIQIKDLGRIKHRTYPHIAASPDGLILSSSADCSKDLVGRLVEIKCPPSRPITETIPFDYWCQMQWQMEVCDRPLCEYVEAKIRQLNDTDEPNPSASHRGWITLQTNMNTSVNRYIYHPLTQPPQEDDSWINLETYEWELVQLRRVTIPRDTQWFQTSQPIFEAFWNDVEAARQGTWIPLPVKTRKAKGTTSTCAIVDDTQEQTSEQTITVARDVPEPL